MGAPGSEMRRRTVSAHWQCQCGEAGNKGRICDVCGTPFEWEPSRDEWAEMGPLPGETMREHMAKYDAARGES